MKGIQLLFLIVISVVLTAANPTAYDDGLENAVNEKNLVKEIPKATSECVPFPRPVDCEEVRLNNNTESGVYTIWPRSRKTPCKCIEVYCDMTVDGGGWTVLQRRGKYGNPENYFHQTWEIYKHGFGELEKEFWLGNELIYALTNQGPYAVRFDMRAVNGTSAYAVYDQFWIEDEERKYQLNIAGYSGNAGDSMSYHHSMKFTTLDSHNDKSTKNCASKRSGGWWFKDCFESNFNGLNKQGKYVAIEKFGIVWEKFAGYLNSLEFTEIKIKQTHFR